MWVTPQLRHNASQVSTDDFVVSCFYADRVLIREAFFARRFGFTMVSHFGHLSTILSVCNAAFAAIAERMAKGMLEHTCRQAGSDPLAHRTHTGSASEIVYSSNALVGWSGDRCPVLRLL